MDGIPVIGPGLDEYGGPQPWDVLLEYPYLDRLGVQNVSADADPGEVPSCRGRSYELRKERNKRSSLDTGFPQ
jgi:hypothetical protein